jgi:hypothetical protein
MEIAKKSHNNVDLAIPRSTLEIESMDQAVKIQLQPNL